MSDVDFQIGKELGELKARLDNIEGAGCGCRGKARGAARRTPLCGKLESLHPLIIDAVNKVLAASFTDSKIDTQLYLRNYVLSERQVSSDDICCYYCENGDYCCGDCNDPTCRNC